MRPAGKAWFCRRKPLFFTADDAPFGYVRSSPPTGRNGRTFRRARPLSRFGKALTALFCRRRSTRPRPIDGARTRREPVNRRLRREYASHPHRRGAHGAWRRNARQPGRIPFLHCRSAYGFDAGDAHTRRGFLGVPYPPLRTPRRACPPGVSRSFRRTDRPPFRFETLDRRPMTGLLSDIRGRNSAPEDL
jgi:hypothetical protein